MGQSPAGTTCNTDGIGIPLLNGPTEFGSHHPSAIQFTTDAKRYAKPGDILFCVRGSTTGRMNWADRVYAIGRGIGAIRHKQGVEYQPLVRGVIECELSDLLTQATGSTFPNVSASQLSKIRWPALEDAEQRRIAHILGTLDDKIENNRKTAKTLEAMAQAIFKSWFVDFDPVRAKMNGEPKESICKRLKLTPEILDLFPDRLVDSEMGEIPEGWRVGPIGDLATIVGGGTPSTAIPEYWDNGVHAWATPKDLSRLTTPVLFSTERRITDQGLAAVSSGLLPIGTVLLSSRAPIGYLAITDIPMAINQGFIAMKPTDGISNVFLLLSARQNMDEIVGRANGSTFLEISKASFRQISLVAPTEELMAAFHQIAHGLFEVIANTSRQARGIAGLRDSLLPKLVSGEIRVPEVTQMLEQATG